MKPKVRMLPFFAPDEPGAGAAGELDFDNLPDDHQVPVSVLRRIREDERTKRVAAEEKAAMTQDQLLIYQTALRSGQGGGNQQQAAPVDPLEAFFAGREANDVVTVEEIKQLAQSMNVNQAEQGRIAQVMAQPGYREIMEQYVPRMLAEDPTLVADLQAIASPSARYNMAYKLAKKSGAYLADQAKGAMHPNVDAAKKNLEKPGSPSSVGAGGAQSSTLADRISNAKVGSPEWKQIKEDRRTGKLR